MTAASSADTIAGVNQFSFSKTVIRILEPTYGALPANSTRARDCSGAIYLASSFGSRCLENCRWAIRRSGYDADP